MQVFLKERVLGAALAGMEGRKERRKTLNLKPGYGPLKTGESRHWGSETEGIGMQ